MIIKLDRPIPPRQFVSASVIALLYPQVNLSALPFRTDGSVTTYDAVRALEIVSGQAPAPEPKARVSKGWKAIRLSPLETVERNGSVYHSAKTTNAHFGYKSKSSLVNVRRKCDCMIKIGNDCYYDWSAIEAYHKATAQFRK